MGTKRTSLVLGHNWSDSPGSSGKIPNLINLYFMDLVVTCSREVNAVIDHDGIH